MHKFVKLSLSLILSAAIVGCTANNGVRKQDVGVVTGGALGGVLGSQVGRGSGRVAATIGGTILGAFIGGSVGKSMDDVDQLKMQRALETNRTGQSTRWRNPDSGNTYVVTPTKTAVPSGASQPCREYTTTAYIGGKKEEIYGKACRQRDGSWKIVNSH